jgi:hypothetical protein
MKDKILNHVEDLVSDLLYYDRKECEDLKMGQIESVIENGEITIDEMVERFKIALIKGVKP